MRVGLPAAWHATAAPGEPGTKKAPFGAIGKRSTILYWFLVGLVARTTCKELLNSAVLIAWIG